MKNFLAYSYYKLVSFYIKNGQKTEPEWLVMTLISLLLAFNFLSMIFLIKLILFLLFSQHFSVNKILFGIPFLISLIFCYFTLFKKSDQILSYWKNRAQEKKYKKFSVFIYIFLSVICFFSLMTITLKTTGGW